MVSDISLDEARDLKDELERTITKAIVGFERNTHLSVRAVTLTHLESIRTSRRVPPPEVVDVSIEVEL